MYKLRNQKQLDKYYEFTHISTQAKTNVAALLSYIENRHRYDPSILCSDEYDDMSLWIEVPLSIFDIEFEVYDDGTITAAYSNGTEGSLEVCASKDVDVVVEFFKMMRERDGELYTFLYRLIAAGTERIDKPSPEFLEEYGNSIARVKELVSKKWWDNRDENS